MIDEYLTRRLLVSILSGRSETHEVTYAADDFRSGIRNGFEFYADLDQEDIATLARIASGEAWEEI